ncbi:MAG TPA: hypothetical protein VGK79_05115 [Gaiellaceae bacterium]
MPVWIVAVHRDRVAVILGSELDAIRPEALPCDIEIIDDERDMPEPGRLRLTGGRLLLRLEQPELHSRLTNEDKLVVRRWLIQDRQPEDILVPRDRARTISDVE